MMEAARTSETSVYNYFTRQYIPEDNSELQSPLLLYQSMKSPCIATNDIIMNKYDMTNHQLQNLGHLICYGTVVRRIDAYISSVVHYSLFLL
jgi:hypothetical protein